MTPKAQFFLKSSLVGLALASVSPAQAQQAEEEATSEGDIVVTAQFREQKLQDTPLAITAVSADQLEARSQTSITDVGAFAPNVNLSPATAINGNSLTAFIRGIGQDDSSFALEPGVGIYVDDVYYGTTFGAVLDLTDLERVEVLRGPQGTLAGKNSLGGAVKLFSRRPDENGGGFIEAGYGRYNRVNVRGSAGFTLGEGLYGRLSGTFDRRDGFFKLLDYGCVNPAGGIAATTTGMGCVTGTQGGTNTVALRGALRYAPSGSRVEINLVGDYSRSNNEGVPTKTVVANTAFLAPALAAQAYRSYVPGNPFAGVPFDSRFLTGAQSYTSYENFSGAGNYTTIFCLNPANALTCFPTSQAPTAFTDAPRNDARNYGISGTIDIELSDALNLTSITAFRKANGTAVFEIDGTPINLLKERLTKRHRQFSQELRLSGQLGTFADFTLGGFYYKARELEDFRINIPTFLYDFETEDPVSNRSTAAFLHVELHPAENLNIIAGLRYTDDRKTYRFVRLNSNNTPISGIPVTPNFLVASLNGLTGTFADNRVDYRIGANYRFSDSLMVYAQISTGYKGGGINPRPFVADQVVPFGPETVTTYEFGFKSDFADRRVRLNGALFYNDYKDIQRNLFVCPTSASQTCSLPVNAGNGRSQGFELETLIRPAGGLMIDGSIGYLDFKYKSINPLTFITLAMDAPFNSKWNASAGIQYEADLGGSGKLTPRLDWTYQSSFFYNSVNSPFNQVAGRSLFNARLSYETEDGNWSVSAAVTNLTNKFYYIANSENLANFGLSTGVVGRPREWQVSIKRRF